jgi:ribosomal protein S18 acetylase RimI-like enzyme
MRVRVRRLRADEAGALREVRLRALRDAPEAFWATWEREAALGADEWARRAEEAGAGERAVVAVAQAGDGPLVALAGGRLDDEDPGRADLWGTWVDPAWRGGGRGLGAAVVEEVVAWARSRGAGRLVLWVSDEVPAAAALYTRLGFVPTGRIGPEGGERRYAQAVLEL